MQTHIKLNKYYKIIKFYYEVYNFRGYRRTVNLNLIEIPI